MVEEIIYKSTNDKSLGNQIPFANGARRSRPTKYHKCYSNRFGSEDCEGIQKCLCFYVMSDTAIMEQQPRCLGNTDRPIKGT